jgi:hypothetical protein
MPACASPRFRCPAVHGPGRPALPRQRAPGSGTRSRSRRATQTDASRPTGAFGIAQRAAALSTRGSARFLLVRRSSSADQPVACSVPANPGCRNGRAATAHRPRAQTAPSIAEQSSRPPSPHYRSRTKAAAWKRRHTYIPRRQSRSSGTAPGAPDQRDRLVAHMEEWVSRGRG